MKAYLFLIKLCHIREHFSSERGDVLLKDDMHTCTYRNIKLHGNCAYTVHIHDGKVHVSVHGCVWKDALTHASLALRSLAPAAVMVLSMHPSRVAFLGLPCRGLRTETGSIPVILGSLFEQLSGF